METDKELMLNTELTVLMRHALKMNGRGEDSFFVCRYEESDPSKIQIMSDADKSTMIAVIARLDRGFRQYRKFKTPEELAFEKIDTLLREMMELLQHAPTALFKDDVVLDLGLRVNRAKATTEEALCDLRKGGKDEVNFKNMG